MESANPHSLPKLGKLGSFTPASVAGINPPPPPRNEYWALWRIARSVIHAYIHSYIHTNRHVYIMYWHTYIHACVNAYMHTNIQDKRNRDEIYRMALYMIVLLCAVYESASGARTSPKTQCPPHGLRSTQNDHTGRAVRRDKQTTGQKNWGSWLKIYRRACPPGHPQSRGNLLCLVAIFDVIRYLMVFISFCMSCYHSLLFVCLWVSA